MSISSCRPTIHRRGLGAIGVGCSVWRVPVKGDPGGPWWADPKLLRLVKRQLSGGGGAWAGVWGWKVPKRYNRAHLNTQLELWNQPPGQGLDSVPARSCFWWQAVSWHVLGWLPVYWSFFPPVDERVWFLGVLLVNMSHSALIQPLQELGPHYWQ